MVDTTMPLGEYDLRVIWFQETKDIPAACNIEITTITGAIARKMENVAGRRGILEGKGDVNRRFVASSRFTPR